MAFLKIKPVPPENALNAVCYARYSPGPDQSENSIDFQVRAAKEYCQRCGYRLIGTYVDRKVSGTSDHRPEFLRMVEDAEKQQFAFVIVYRFDRFSRNRYDSAIYKRQLERFGVRVLSTEESVGVGDESAILESIYEAMAENYSRRLSRVVKNGMKEKARKGLNTGGATPYAYKVIDHKRVIDEDKAPAVQLCFELYASGKGKTEVAAALNARGYRAKSGKHFDVSAVSRILENKVYTGDNSFMGIERRCPAIITEDLFNKAREIREKNRRTFGEKVTTIDYELSGKLFCGLCGDVMIGDAGTSKSGKRHYYYSCAKRKKARQCRKQSERKDYIEWYVCEQTLKEVLQPDSIKRIAKAVVDRQRMDEKDSDLGRITRRLRQIDKELDGIVDTLLRTKSQTVINKINARAEALEEEKAALEADRAQIKVSQAVALSEGEVAAYLNSFRGGDLLDEEFRRRIIRTFVNCVYLFDDKVVVYYNITGTKQVSYIDILDDLDALQESAEECSDSLRDSPPIVKLSEHAMLLYTGSCFSVVFNRG